MTSQPPPYLAGLPHLPADVRVAVNRDGATPAELARARYHLARLRVLIRQARERHELKTGRLVVPQLPTPGD